MLRQRGETRTCVLVAAPCSKSCARISASPAPPCKAQPSDTGWGRPTSPATPPKGAAPGGHGKGCVRIQTQDVQGQQARLVSSSSDVTRLRSRALLVSWALRRPTHLAALYARSIVFSCAMNGQPQNGKAIPQNAALLSAFRTWRPPTPAA